MAAMPQTAVVLQLPHNLRKLNWLRTRVLAAGDQLHQDYATCALSCFFWNEVDTPQHSLSADEVSDWTRTCDGRFVDFAREVAPAHMDLLRALRVPDMPAGWGPKKRRWQWFYADVPFILVAHERADLFGSSVSRVWYLEWDVGWTGSLGTVLTTLNKTKGRKQRSVRSSNGSLIREDHREFGYGMKHMTCFDCRGSQWQGCRPGSWGGAFSNISMLEHLRKRRTICAGLTPVVWFSPRLLHELFGALRAGVRHYCEAFAAMQCIGSRWCRVDQFSADARRRKRFSHFSYLDFPHSGLVAPNNSASILYHPVKDPTYQGLVPRPPPMGSALDPLGMRPTHGVIHGSRSGTCT
jgi:hypothetical protein